MRVARIEKSTFILQVNIGCRPATGVHVLVASLMLPAAAAARTRVRKRPVCQQCHSGRQLVLIVLILILMNGHLRVGGLVGMSSFKFGKLDTSSRPQGLKASGHDISEHSESPIRGVQAALALATWIMDAQRVCDSAVLTACMSSPARAWITR